MHCKLRANYATRETFILECICTNQVSFFLKSEFSHRCVLKRLCNKAFYLQFYALHNLRYARVYDPLCPCMCNGCRGADRKPLVTLAKMALLRILDLSHLTCASQTNSTVKQHAKIRHSAYPCIVKRTSDYHSRNYLAFPLLHTYVFCNDFIWRQRSLQNNKHESTDYM